MYYYYIIRTFHSMQKTRFMYLKLFIYLCTRKNEKLSFFKRINFIIFEANRTAKVVNCLNSKTKHQLFE